MVSTKDSNDGEYKGFEESLSSTSLLETICAFE